MRYEDGHYVLSSGRRLYANDDRLSVNDDITPDRDHRLAYGLDSHVSEIEDVPLTLEEKKEIASVMIARWMNWVSASPPDVDAEITKLRAELETYKAMEVCTECESLVRPDLAEHNKDGDSYCLGCWEDEGKWT